MACYRDSFTFIGRQYVSPKRLYTPSDLRLVTVFRQSLATRDNGGAGDISIYVHCV
jgi:hypothetical protein